MAHVSPLRGLTPPPQHAARVASVPYDVVDKSEAAALALDNPLSFLHVTKPEIDLKPDAPLAAVYAQGAAALQRLVSLGALVPEPEPAYFVYALTMGAHRQVGVVLQASVRDYNAGIIKKHEFTRPEKEDDRVHHMQALAAQSGKVFLLYRESAALAALLKTITEAPADIAFTAVDGVGHAMWRVAQPERVQGITDAFAAVGPLYIADGHHRAAAAARVAHAQGVADGPLLAVAFASGDAHILPYNRVVRDLHGNTAEEFLHALSALWTVLPGPPKPSRAHQCGMFLGESWYTLQWSVPAGTDAVAALDVSVLQSQILGPLLGITDPRRDKRIDFVGGIRGDAELERRVRHGWAVAFSMHATGVEELLAVADAGHVMPPKSTWFEPKLRDGLVVLPI